MPKPPHSACPPARLVLVTTDLACGGIQRVVVNMARGLAQRGHSVTVVTFAGPQRDFYALPEAVRRLSMNIGTDRSTPWWRLMPEVLRRVTLLKRLILQTDADAVISHAAKINAITLVALWRTSCAVFVTEHGDKPEVPDSGIRWFRRRRLWYRLRRALYPRACRVVSVSHAIDSHFSWLPSQRRVVIHNPVPGLPPLTPEFKLPSGVRLDRPWLVSMGRLTAVKGFDILLEAFSHVASRFPQWQLVIIGEGELREELHTQARRLGLTPQVVFTGALPEPHGVLQRAELFVMASRFEGFPMAHAEALACGLPVIATRCPTRPATGAGGSSVLPASGVSELVRDGTDGRLVPAEDSRALSVALAALMSDPVERRRLAAQARMGVRRFCADAILDRWEEVLRPVLIPRPTARGPGSFRPGPPDQSMNG